MEVYLPGWYAHLTSYSGGGDEFPTAAPRSSTTVTSRKSRRPATEREVALRMLGGMVSHVRCLVCLDGQMVNHSPCLACVVQTGDRNSGATKTDIRCLVCSDSNYVNGYLCLACNDEYGSCSPDYSKYGLCYPPFARVVECKACRGVGRIPIRYWCLAEDKCKPYESIDKRN